MESHSYQLQPRRVLLNLAGILMFLLLLTGLVHGVKTMNWLPPAQETLTVDWLLIHDRLQQANRQNPAEILVAGDSTGAIGLNAKLLEAHLDQTPVYNLSLFIGLTVAEYGEATDYFISNHPDQVRMVVLMLTPDRLVQSDYNNQSMQYWRRTVSGGREEARTELEKLQGKFGMRTVRLRLFNRLLPFVTHQQEEGLFYAQIVACREMLQQQNGSFTLSGYYDQETAPETDDFNLEDANLEAARLFRQHVPEHVLLAFGLTPYPETYVDDNARNRRDALMRQFNQALQADVLLTNLPVVLPDGYFRDRLHLNPRGQEAYTRQVAEVLRPIVENLP